MLEAEVHGTGDEGGRDDEAANLDLEADGVEGVVPEHDTAYVADSFTQATQGHANHVSPCLVSDAESELNEETEAEETCEEAVPANAGIVAIECSLYGTQGRGNINIGTVLGGGRRDSHFGRGSLGFGLRGVEKSSGLGNPK